MKIMINGHIYESVGFTYTDEDVASLLEECNMPSLNKLNSMLEAMSNIPDLEPSDEDAEIEADMQNSSKKDNTSNGDDANKIDSPIAEPDSVDSSNELPEEQNELPEDNQSEEPEEPVDTQEDRLEEPEEEQATSSSEQKDEEEPLPEIKPPAIAPKTELPKEELKDVAWLPTKKLGTLYRNYLEFFGGEQGLNSAGRVVGLKAPGLRQDSNYLQADVTAFIEGTEEMPYSTWIKLRRKRPTQNWSLENPCEVRCSCKAFAYFVANANLKNKSLAGPPATNKKYRDSSGKVRTINFTLPSKVNNPSHTPALCKHLAALTRKLLDNDMITDS